MCVPTDTAPETVGLPRSTLAAVYRPGDGLWSITETTSRDLALCFSEQEALALMARLGP